MRIVETLGPDAGLAGRVGRLHAIGTAFYRRNPILAVVTAGQSLLLVGFLVGIVVDPRTVGGEPVWLKPARFAASIAIFTATLGWLSAHLPVSNRLLRQVSIGIAGATVVEIVLIGGQAGRGVESHFNETTMLDFAIYLVMGVTILGMTLLVAWLLAQCWGRSFDAPPAFAWGIRLGLFLFVLGALEGVVMVAIGTSTVSVSPTIPVLGWSVGGDLRVAHFVGLHALQVLALAGYLAAVAGQRGLLERPLRVFGVVATGYTLVFVLSMGHALGLATAA